MGMAKCAKHDREHVLAITYRSLNVWSRSLQHVLSRTPSSRANHGSDLPWVCPFGPSVHEVETWTTVYLNLDRLNAACGWEMTLVSSIYPLLHAAHWRQDCQWKARSPPQDDPIGSGACRKVAAREFRFVPRRARQIFSRVTVFHFSLARFVGITL
ncbi:hypothetical protein BU25DRAFT_410502 [Macroventuria anomochaeta]|uniref:Uncharacterized protein n=1 Tax=Macroventuria anomochaeta TaxID=301207 RepID=A0ACB6S1M6_9PLEO|nr:uncharacterized protein BU25DRAFT_410502 [Macroventuria anomochaeta]KAF2627853.1 hypothetical protein BU25DRAFT_410502 [Macroventuria anomochaeta]